MKKYEVWWIVRHKWSDNLATKHYTYCQPLSVELHYFRNAGLMMEDVKCPLPLVPHLLYLFLKYLYYSFSNITIHAVHNFTVCQFKRSAKIILQTNGVIVSQNTISALPEMSRQQIQNPGAYEGLHWLPGNNIYFDPLSNTGIVWFMLSTCCENAVFCAANANHFAALPKDEDSGSN